MSLLLGRWRFPVFFFFSFASFRCVPELLAAILLQGGRRVGWLGIVWSGAGAEAFLSFLRPPLDIGSIMHPIDKVHHKS